MSNQGREPLTQEELDELKGEQLPDREAMSTIPLEDPIGGFTLPVSPVDDPGQPAPVDPAPPPE